MPQIARESLLSLESYARERNAFRARVIAHKKTRNVQLGEHVQLLFEDELTVRYQVQEMLRIERIFEDEGIQGELDVYNPMIPDGGNWKATMLIEYEDPGERRIRLLGLGGIEDRVWMQVEGGERLIAIADEDLDREEGGKTSAVHFLRFEVPEQDRRALKAGAALAVGVDHPNYGASVVVPPAVRASLAADLA
ncbi:MAG: DUF3501 family protein [Betaproteobacteria bacterium]